MMPTEATIDDVDVEVSIADGRVAMNADADGTVYVQTPDIEVLSPEQTVVSVSVTGDGVTSRIELDRDATRVLAETLTGVSDR